MSNRLQFVDTKDSYDHDTRVYRTEDGKVSVNVYGLGDYYWIKLKTVHGPGRDGALNLTKTSVQELMKIFRHIDKNSK
jgi:hypothetical protein